MHRFQFVLLIMQFISLSCMGWVIWDSATDFLFIRTLRRKLLKAFDDPEKSRAGEEMGRQYNYLTAVAKASSLCLAILMGLWALELILDIALTITKL